MWNGMKKSFKHVKSKEDTAFQQYQLNISVGIIRIFIIIMAAFNFLLIIPDYIHIQQADGRFAVIALRISFIIVATALFICMKKIKSFNKLALAVSGCELLAIIVFFYIFLLYESPNYIIQLLGLFIMILAFYFIPNRWEYILGVSVISGIGFIMCSYFVLDKINSVEMMAGFIYLAVEIVLCATFTRYFQQYQRSEYQAKMELQRIYSTDPLTQVGNRIRLEDEAEKWIEFCSRYGLSLSLVLIDVDNLKKINDKYGHLIGDVILYELAQIMHTQLRKNDVCTRWGW